MAKIVFFATFASSKDADYSRYGGILTASSTGTSSITGSRLVFNSGSAARVSFNPLRNFPMTDQYSVRFKFRPGYSGAPASEQRYFSQSRNENDANWLCDIRQEVETKMRATVQTNNTTAGLDGNFTPVSGTTYEYLLTADFLNGVHKQFIDGVQIGINGTGSGMRDALGRVMYIGQNYDLNSAHIANFAISDLALYEGLVETSNYTPGYTLTTPVADSDPGTANVTDGITYGFGDVLKTGTAPSGLTNVVSGPILSAGDFSAVLEEE